MIPATADLTIYQGATWTQKVVWRTGATRTIVNLAGYSARMQARANAASATVLVELTTANSRITLGGVTGEITMTLSAAETAGLAAGEYVYDLELVSGAVVTRVLQGKLTVSAEVTR